MDTTLNKLAIKIHRVDKDVVLAVREQSKSQAKGRKDLADAKASVQVNLFPIKSC